MTQPKKILILMSDTGGGHRAAAEAIRDALTARHGDAVQIEMVDVFRQYSPFPLKYAPELYPWWIKNGKLMWRMGYRISDRRSQTHLINTSLTATIRRGLRRLLLTEPMADAIVCVHPLLSTPAIRVLNRQPQRPPFITVVTDLVSTHALWYEPAVDRILVPTQPALDRGLKLEIRPDRMRVTGLPVNPRFAAGLIDKQEARRRLGWAADLPALLMIGGGDGMGPLYRIARAVNALGEHCQIAVVAGRNALLKERLDSAEWNQPTHIYPFVTNMPELMAAADLLITKAGPATISEACMAGLPMILSDAIPGQEDGNVRYVVGHKAGLWARGSRRVKAAVADWLAQGAEFLEERGEAAHQLARPDAVWQIADEIWQQAQRPPVISTRHSRKRKQPDG